MGEEKRKKMIFILPPHIYLLHQRVKMGLRIGNELMPHLFVGVELGDVSFIQVPQHLTEQLFNAYRILFFLSHQPGEARSRHRTSCTVV